MKIFYKQNSIINTKTGWVTVVFCLFAIFFLSSVGIKYADALVATDPLAVPTDSKVSNILQTSLVADSKAGLAKEFTLDGILNAGMKLVISNVTSSIVNWINSGFQGGPAFITNPESFFTDVADQVAGNFIAGTELGFLCEPFSSDIRIALNIGYSSSFTQRNYCRLSDIINNTENFAKFTAGDFSQGGWDSWFEITQNPSNNPLGAYIAAETELTQRTSSAQQTEKLKLDWGDGFLSFQECEVRGPSGSGDPNDAPCEKYGDIKTPGTIINNQLSDTLGTGFRQLELADEINEIVGALVGQLVNTVLKEGLSSFGSGGSNFNSLSSVDRGPALTAWCFADVSSSLLGGNVTWTVDTFGGAAGVPTYFWSGDGVQDAVSPSVTVAYITPGYKTASVRVTKGGENIFQNCNSGVLVE